VPGSGGSSDCLSVILASTPFASNLPPLPAASQCQAASIGVNAWCRSWNVGVALATKSVHDRLGCGQTATINLFAGQRTASRITTINCPPTRAPARAAADVSVRTRALDDRLCER
jgi:hypothetical protein